MVEAVFWPFSKFFWKCFWIPLPSLLRGNYWFSSPFFCFFASPRKLGCPPDCFLGLVLKITENPGLKKNLLGITFYLWSCCFAPAVPTHFGIVFQMSKIAWEHLGGKNAWGPRRLIQKMKRVELTWGWSGILFEDPSMFMPDLIFPGTINLTGLQCPHQREFPHFAPEKESLSFFFLLASTQWIFQMNPSAIQKEFESNAKTHVWAPFFVPPPPWQK